MTVPGNQVALEAAKYLGRAEDPSGSNTGPFVIKCQRCTFLAGTRWPWCAAFVCFIAAKLGVPLAYNSAGAHDLANHHTATRQTIESAMPGDVCDWNLGSGHTSILEAKGAASWTTIDGNWGDKVARVAHPLSELRMVWRIPGVSDAAPVPKPPRLPRFVITTSASGHRKVLYRTDSKRGLYKWLAAHNIAGFANGITISRARRK